MARRCTGLAITVAAGPEPLLRGSPGRKSTGAEIRDLHASSCHASPWATKRDPPGDRTRHASMRIDANGRLPLPGTERASAHDKRSTAVVAMHGGWIRHLATPHCVTRVSARPTACATASLHCRSPRCICGSSLPVPENPPRVPERTRRDPRRNSHPVHPAHDNRYRPGVTEHPMYGLFTETPQARRVTALGQEPS